MRTLELATTAADHIPDAVDDSVNGVEESQEDVPFPASGHKLGLAVTTRLLKRLYIFYPKMHCFLFNPGISGFSPGTISVKLNYG